MAFAASETGLSVTRSATCAGEVAVQNCALCAVIWAFRAGCTVQIRARSTSCAIDVAAWHCAKSTLWITGLA